MPQQQLKPPEKVNYEQLAQKHLAEGAYFEAGKAYFKAAQGYSRIKNDSAANNTYFKAAQAYSKEADEYRKKGDFLKSAVLFHIARKVSEVADWEHFKIYLTADADSPTKKRILEESKAVALAIDALIATNEVCINLRQTVKPRIPATSVIAVLPASVDFDHLGDDTIDSILVRCAKESINNSQFNIQVRHWFDAASEYLNLAHFTIDSISDSTVKAELKQSLRQTIAEFNQNLDKNEPGTPRPESYPQIK